MDLDNIIESTIVFVLSIPIFYSMLPYVVAGFKNLIICLSVTWSAIILICVMFPSIFD